MSLAAVSSFLLLWLVWHYRSDNSIVYPTVRGSASLSRFVFVTAYFDGPSKHRTSEYEVWITHFLHIFVGELYFYTTPHWKQLLTNRTKVSHNVHFRLNYSDPFDIPCVRPLRSAYEKQWPLDPERRSHRGSHVYAVWNGKICLVSEVSLLEPNAIILWIDSGSCREKIYWNIVFPNASRLASVIKLETRGAMIFAAWHHITLKPVWPMKCHRSALAIGGLFGGDQTALREYWTFFWAIHDYFLQRGEFVGNDQHLMSTYLIYTDLAWVQPNYQAYRGKCDPWFSTFSLYGDTSICFKDPPVLHPRSEYGPIDSNRSFLKEWIKSFNAPFHPFGE
jgi:hypothetical protein